MHFFKSTRRFKLSRIISSIALALGIVVATASYSSESVQPVNTWEVQEWNVEPAPSPPNQVSKTTPHPGVVDAIVNWGMAMGRGHNNIREDLIRQYVMVSFAEAAKHGIDPLLSLSVMAVESRFNYKATSGSGAKGLMQVIPFWHKNKITAAEVYDPAANIRAGTQILKDCKTLQRGNVNRALLCYNGSLKVVGADYDRKVLNTRNSLKRAIERNLLVTSSSK